MPFLKGPIIPRRRLPALIGFTLLGSILGALSLRDGSGEGHARRRRNGDDRGCGFFVGRRHDHLSRASATRILNSWKVKPHLAVCGKLIDVARYLFVGSHYVHMGVAVVMCKYTCMLF